MEEALEIKPQNYQIIFRGTLDESWQMWFGDFILTSEKDEKGFSLTILTGSVVDQSALRGILNKLWNLNMSLVSVNLVEAEFQEDIRV